MKIEEKKHLNSYIHLLLLEILTKSTYFLVYVFRIQNQKFVWYAVCMSKVCRLIFK